MGWTRLLFNGRIWIWISQDELSDNPHRDFLWVNAKKLISKMHGDNNSKEKGDYNES